ncbi:MAG: hypothetical protein ABSA90_04030 [Xanthobacteraceae bacterium]|jgi:hypothetical protein
MVRNSNVRFRKACAGFAAVCALMVLAMPVRAADPIFPPGSRIGLVPPVGMVTADAFFGFMDVNKDAAILIAALPAAAYSQIEKTMDTEALRKQGITLDKREPMQLNVGKGFLFTGRQVVDKARYRKWLLVAAASDLTALVTVQVPEQENAYPDRVVRAALATLAVRPSVPQAEELSLLPFDIGDLAGFQIDSVLRGRALVLSDAQSGEPKDSAKEPPEAGRNARLLIAAMPGGPAEPDERASFARLSFNEIAGIRDVHITMAEPLRIGGQPGYQSMAEAKDARSGNDVMVVQWLRFGSGGFLQMTGIAPADHWTSVLARLRTIRDSIEPK